MRIGHKGHGLKITHVIKETVALHPESCPGCGNDLQDEKGKRVESRYIPEIKIETTMYVVYEKHGQKCGAVSCGEFPESVSSTQHYGPHLKAFMVMLSQVWSA
ncbi:MAG: hypothetical protein LBT14_08690 [Treponema sp.]|jgi:hypothetical protein|nr:hypothetical protein [Treponema sp.]